MKKTFVTAALVLAASTLLASCAQQGTTATGVGGIVNATDFANIASTPSALHSILAVDLASAASLMGSNGSAFALRLMKAGETSSSSSADTGAAAEDPLADLLSSVDLFLAKDPSFKTEEVTSTREGYAYQLNLTYSLFGGEATTLSLNYNSVEEENEISSEESEKKITITGVSLIDSVDYTFTLESKTETSKDEHESEALFHLAKDAENYVEVKNAVEIEENEKELKYSYRSVAAGVQEQAFKLSFENEDDGQEEETKIVTLEKSYTLESYVKESTTFIEVKVKDNATAVETKATYERVIDRSSGSEVITYRLVA
jgi:predicted small secreted protein